MGAYKEDLNQEQGYSKADMYYYQNLKLKAKIAELELELKKIKAENE